tara:strand:- start:837 stop:1295 length:459 start_codon:yes stop_codon:yes gene_type:complete
MKKRAVSPVIATILLITIGIVLATIIFIWATSFIGESVQKFDKAIELSCDKVNFDAEVSFSNSKHFLNVINRGDVPIYDLVVTSKQSGSRKTVDFEGNKQGEVNIGETISFELDPLGNINELVVVPTILGESDTGKKSYTCEDRYSVLARVL